MQKSQLTHQLTTEKKKFSKVQSAEDYEELKLRLNEARKERKTVESKIDSRQKEQKNLDSKRINLDKQLKAKIENL